MPSPWAAGAQVRIKGTIHGQETVNVLHFATNEAEFDVAPPSPLLLALAQAVFECIIDTLMPAVTQDWAFRGVEAQYVYLGGGFTDPVVVTAPANTVGGLGVTSVGFAASLIHLRSGFAGRSGRGRVFLPPPGEAQVANGTMDEPTSQLLVAFLNCMVGKFLGQSPTTVWRLGIFSRKNGGTNHANWDNGFVIASQLTPDPVLAVIGRRKIGRGD